MTSPSPHAVCITADPTLRRSLRRSLQAAGSTVEFRTARGTSEHELPPRIFVVDQDARKELDVPGLVELTDLDAEIICVGDSLEDDEVVSLLRNNPLDHVISDAGQGDEDELVVTSVKLLSGDIFGLEKYLAWGVKIHEARIDSYEGKRTALRTIAEHAKQVGARRQAIARIESVTDELLMNAMYDAPAVSRGEAPRVPPAQNQSDGSEPSALLRYACDGRYFAVSVEDTYGGLRKEAILDHLIRARAERGRPRDNSQEGGGAGLGLYFVLSSVTRFIANIEPGRRTEVVCLFDLRLSGRESDACTRSLHVFTTS
jgi:hypothetical protein